jgi:hypothetical protein
MKIITGLLSALSRALRIAQRWVEGPIYQAGYKQACEDAFEVVRKNYPEVSRHALEIYQDKSATPRLCGILSGDFAKLIRALPEERFRP